MQLSKITSARLTLAIPIGDETLNVVYRPQAITLELVDRKEIAQTIPGETLALTLVELIESWDLIDDQGNTYPLTVEAVKRLPVEFVNAVLEVVLRESRLNPTKANSLAGGLPPAGSLASNRNGTH